MLQSAVIPPLVRIPLRIPSQPRIPHQRLHSECGPSSILWCQELVGQVKVLVLLCECICGGDKDEEDKEGGDGGMHLKKKKKKKL